jgi:hypothetical protein
MQEAIPIEVAQSRGPWGVLEGDVGRPPRRYPITAHHQSEFKITMQVDWPMIKGKRDSNN